MRTELREMLKAAFEKTYDRAFDFGTGFLEDINGESYKLPCIWVCPFELISKTGRSEGFRVYLGTIYLLELGDGLTAQEKDERWDAMEDAAIEVLNQLIEQSPSEIVAVDKIKGIPNEGAYTGYNDISLKVTFEVTVRYCVDRG